MSATLTKLIILMAAVLPFCCSSTVGDGTLNIEVWRRVWRPSNDSLSSGTYVNKFYHCMATLIGENVLLTSARCIQRLSAQSAIKSIYLYGNYNQTKSIMHRVPSLFIRFLVNPDSQEFYRSSPMMFNVNRVIYHNSSDHYQRFDPDYALVILKDPVFLNDEIEYVELLSAENLYQIDYDNCRIVSINRDHSKRDANATCEVTAGRIDLSKINLNCRIKNVEDFPMIFDSGSPVYCPLLYSAEYLQVGLVSKYSILFPELRVSLIKPKFESVVDVILPNIYGNN
ncbi:uncharacterized protein LOC130663662 [Microplitis mediator]|uniref:uncharacterized protein LOC130663662 n=1 Tax=Microplitis mediator TaxID=375433 RepID=UPI00255333C4|nr:uncharacterized protein LOC130663662 [Microplitis mediator]